MPKKLTLNEFIERAKKVHGDKYDYSKVEYLNSSSKLEQQVCLSLNRYNIEYEEQKTFDWLIYKSNLKLDFYLPNYNIAIECQGEQHYRPVDTFGGQESFITTQKRDKVKKELCEQHGIKVFYLSDKKNTIIDVYTDIDKLINEIIANKRKSGKI